jgi:hypothetical protein
MKIAARLIHKTSASARIVNVCFDKNAAAAIFDARHFHLIQDINYSCRKTPSFSHIITVVFPFLIIIFVPACR